MINSTNEHQLVSTNSFELNTGLSDDSGLPNSSISSNSSATNNSRVLGLCKYEFELAESDGEEFDSLENFSDGGMSADNFNTLKKVPLIAPIDPPPEFQDSPLTTLQRSQFLQNYAIKIAKTLIANACSVYTNLPPVFRQSSDTNYSYTIEDDYDDILLNNNDPIYNEPTAENIYDEPPLLYEPSTNRIIKTPPTTATTTNTNTNSNSSGSKFKLKKILYSPLHHGSNLSTINRPNSRNSLNSRLSSSHNSLSVSTSNKVDDSIFITQAMSHDALLGREIIDFYNVPLDSDIYALPIDFVTKNRHHSRVQHHSHRSKHITTNTTTTSTSKQQNYNISNNNILTNNIKKRRRNNYNNNNDASSSCCVSGNNNNNNYYFNNNKSKTKGNDCNNIDSKRHSVPTDAINTNVVTLEPMHMTLDEVKQFYNNVYSASSTSLHSSQESLDNFNRKIYHGGGVSNKKCGGLTTSNTTNNIGFGSTRNCTPVVVAGSQVITKNSSIGNLSGVGNCKLFKSKKNGKLSKEEQLLQTNDVNRTTTKQQTTGHHKKSQFSINLKQKFCSIFRFRKSTSSSTPLNSTVSASQLSLNNNNIDQSIHYGVTNEGESGKKQKFSTRALPPLPGITTISNNILSSNISSSKTTISNKNNNVETNPISTTDPPPITENLVVGNMDFAANLEIVKNCGWYWGPISSESAEKILSNEPDGSFIVRDSSDDHYIFSLTFKLTGCIRHVRIDQDQGEFSFGQRALFKSRTITEFIENAVEHSRSGRYLFFLHRRPEHGPMRVQLTNPVSRFRHIQSLQHLSRFVILKAVVRKDLIQTLPLPRRLLDYLSYKNCYSEQVESDSSQSQVSGDEINV